MSDPAAARRSGWRLIAVLVLAWAVVGMRSMGSGHHGVAVAGGHVSHAVATVVDGPHVHQAMTRAGSHHIDALGVAVAPETAAKSGLTHCLECLAPGEQTPGALCLAVLSSLLALVLLLALSRLSRDHVRLLPRLLARALDAMRPPLRRLALSPIEVCVLRT